MDRGISRILIQNYKSLGQVDVELGRFTVLVGRNGTGKSNLVDALAFVQESLADSIELAFKNRGGIAVVRRKSGGHPTHIRMRLAMDLGAGSRADYSFEIAAKPGERFRVSHERCIVKPFMEAAGEHRFEIKDGEFSQPIPGIRPKVSPDRLALFAASATDEFRPVYDLLTSIRVYSIAPESLRELQEPDSGEFLRRDGSNAAAVLKRLQDQADKGAYERVCSLLSKVVEGVSKVEYHAVAQRETMRFKQEVGQAHPWTFDALNMSDGTLRVLGLLLAVYQPGPVSVAAIEEPEATVHPAVAEALLAVLLDASEDRQMLVTTHSPDLLDSKQLDDTRIRVVTMHEGRTLVAPVDRETRTEIRTHLYSPGEMLRVDELTPDPEAARREAEQLDLFSASLPEGNMSQ